MGDVMGHSLQARLFLALLAVAAVAVVVASLLANRRTANQFQQYLGQVYALEQQAIARVLTEQLQPGDLPATQNLLNALGQAYGREIRLVDATGRIWAASPPVRRGPPANRGQPLAGFRQLPLIFQVDTQTNEPTVTSLLPELPTALAAGIRQAATAVGNGALSSEQNFLGSVNRTFVVAAVLAVVLAGMLSVALAQRILGPVRHLTAAARRMGQGDWEQRVPIEGEDEIAALGRAFNAMADSLAHQEELRRNMVSDVAHELRTPLANIRGYLEAMQDGVVTLDATAIGSLLEEALLLQRLINDLQELSLAETGQLHLDIGQVSAESLIPSLLASFQVAAQAKNISLTAHSVPDLPLIAADPERLKQILSNLLRNAILYTPIGGRVHLSAARQGDAVALTVSDDGPGIPPEHLPHIFERFYRADHSRARATGGSGLGLAIARALCEMQGGRIQVASQIGQGTTFVVSLPVTPSVVA